MAESKTLYKDRKNGQVSGVLAGFAEYANLDPTLVRLLFVFIAFVTGVIPGVIFYFIAAIVMPDKPEKK